MDISNYPSASGVYLMQDEKGEIIYVGKAKNLKKRISSYFKAHLDSVKTAALMQHVKTIETIVTQNETEALILENNLIKQYHPRYNICFRDDKSYAYLIISKDDFPAVYIKRQKARNNQECYGPYPSSMAIKKTLNLLQKIFRIRSCKNSFFKARQRPCLQYQLKRCLAPCVGLITEEDYSEAIKNLRLFLMNKNQEILKNIKYKMQEAAEQKAYEKAANYRDQIEYIQEVQVRQSVEIAMGDADVLAMEELESSIAIECLFIRQGKIINQELITSKKTEEKTPDEIITAFILQYYLDRPNFIPSEIIINAPLAKIKKAQLEKILKNFAERKIEIKSSVRGVRKQWLELAKKNLQINLSASANHQENKNILAWEALEKLMQISCDRIECFDVSHTSGKDTMASCVVFAKEGALKNNYRKYAIREIKNSDDCAALKQVLTRRYTRLLRESQIREKETTKITYMPRDGEEGEVSAARSLACEVSTAECLPHHPSRNRSDLKEPETLPSLIVIDGGVGQLNAAIEVMQNLKINIPLLSISKGMARKPGLETLHIPNQPSFRLASHDPLLHLLQRIRDEAHRFAISAHRQRRQKNFITPSLESSQRKRISIK